MVKITNECCNCATSGYPCLGEDCPNLHVKNYYCDECGDAYEEIYYYDGRELCINCIRDFLVKVE